jgi:hypothetical protein
VPCDADGSHCDGRVGIVGMTATIEAIQSAIQSIPNATIHSPVGVIEVFFFFFLPCDLSVVVLRLSNGWFQHVATRNVCSTTGSGFKHTVGTLVANRATLH